MKKVKIITVILAIALIALVAFAGVYVKTQNRMENKVKDYSLGRTFAGARVVEIKVASDDDEQSNDETINVEENEEGAEEENIIEENITTNTEDLEKYETVKKTVEKRLENLGCQDYTISLNEKNGTIRIELPENDKTDTYVYYLTASGKVEITDKDDTSKVLISDDMIKSAQYSYSQNSEGAYQVYLELTLTKDGQNKINEYSETYAFLKTEIEEIEAAQKAEETTEDVEETTDENTDGVADETTDGEQIVDEEQQENIENTTEKKEYKKIATTKIADTEYKIYKIEKNKITLLVGSATTNSTSINNNMSVAAERTMLINSGKYPIDYETENNRLVYSDINKTQIMYFAIVMLIILLIIFVVFTIKYRWQGLLCSISTIGFVALLSLLIRYTNVIISVEGIGAIIIIVLIDLMMNKMILDKVKTMNLINEAITRTYKELFSRLVPVIIITLVFCFSGWTNLSSFGMVMFWGLILIAIYNIVVTKTLLKLKESK